MPSSYDPNAFNALQGDLKLGPAPLSDSLKEETERVLREEPDESRDIADNSAQVNGNGDVKERERDGKDEDAKPSGDAPSAAPSGLIAPTTADLLPQPPTFRSVDVKREVEKVRDARKRIKLDASILFADSGREANGFVHGGALASSSKILASALPSICTYTFHDALDGCAAKFMCVVPSSEINHIGSTVRHFPRTRRYWQPASPRAIFDYGASRRRNSKVCEVTSILVRFRTVCLFPYARVHHLLTSGCLCLSDIFEENPGKARQLHAKTCGSFGTCLCGIL